MITARAQVIVRYAETDMMGIVYHANYLPWFEVARTQLLREQGFPYRQLETDGYAAFAAAGVSRASLSASDTAVSEPLSRQSAGSGNTIGPLSAGCRRF